MKRQHITSGPRSEDAVCVLMADEKEDDHHHHFQEILIPLQSPSFVFGIGLLLLSGSRTLSTAIKLADGALKASKTLPELQSPYSPSSLVAAPKAIIKAYEISSRFNPFKSVPGSGPSIALKRIKACLGAANLVRYACDGFLGLGIWNGGYKVSKNLVKVIEGFGALELDSVARSGLKSLGMMVKAAMVAEEIERRIAIRRWKQNRCQFGSGVQLRYGVCLSSKGVAFAYDYAGGFPLDDPLLTYVSSVGFFENHCHERVSELFSLSIPVYSEMPSIPVPCSW